MKVKRCPRIASQLHRESVPCIACHYPADVRSVCPHTDYESPRDLNMCQMAERCAPNVRLKDVMILKRLAFMRLTVS